jgi:hypothetical protein
MPEIVERDEGGVECAIRQSCRKNCGRGWLCPLSPNELTKSRGRFNRKRLQRRVHSLEGQHKLISDRRGSLSQFGPIMQHDFPMVRSHELHPVLSGTRNLQALLLQKSPSLGNILPRSKKHFGELIRLAGSVHAWRAYFHQLE